jgi:hypothetical protein
MSIRTSAITILAATMTKFTTAHESGPLAVAKDAATSVDWVVDASKQRLNNGFNDMFMRANDS